MINKLGSTHEYIFKLDLNELKKLGYDVVLLREIAKDVIIIDAQILESSDSVNALVCLTTPEDDGIPFLEFEANPNSFEISENSITEMLRLFFEGNLNEAYDETYEDAKNVINTILFTLSETGAITNFKNDKYYTEDGFRVIDKNGYSSFINSDEYKALKAKNIKRKKTVLKNDNKGDKIVKIDFKGKNE